MQTVTELAEVVGIKAACDSLGMARASFYRHRQPDGAPARQGSPRPTPARALRPEERTAVLDVLHAERFQDRSPAAVQATLLDEGRYLCSTRTMYRVLE